MGVTYTGHRQFYKDFFATLVFDRQERIAAPDTDGDNNNMLLEYFLSLPATQRWMTVSVPQPVHLELGRPVCSEDFFNTFEFHVTSTNQRGDDIILSLDSDLPNRGVATEAQLYARLCAQLLEQQPPLILWIRHLYPNLRDAIIGSDLKWRTRCLMRCLRTLLLTPKDGTVYCLVHRGPGNPRREVISQVVAVTQESEIAFRLLFSTELGSETDLRIETPCTRIELASEEAIALMEQDLRTRIQKLIEHQPTVEPARATKFRALNSEIDVRCMSRLTNIMDIASLQSLPSVRGLDFTFPPAYRVSRCAENGMPWVIPVVAWIKHAIRPLSQAELSRILEIEWAKTKVSSSHEAFASGEILFVNFQRTLPDLLWVRGDLIVLRQDFGNFGQLWSRYLPDCGCPNEYIANTCLDFLEAFSPNGAQETQATGDDEAKAKGINPNGAISKYATRYWMEHYYRACPNLVPENAPFRLMLAGKLEFDQNAWAHYLATSYWSSEIGENLRNKALPQNLKQVFGLSLLESSYLSYRIVTLPLCIEDDFDHLLLGIASEIVEEAKYYDMVQVTCKILSQDRCSGTLTRVIAGASDNRRTQLLAAHNDFLRENSLQTLLTSIAVGNVGAVTDLLAQTPVAPPDETQAEGSSYLATPLQVACEYGDSELVAEILKFENLGFPLERSFSWNALHIACHLAWGNIVDTLSHRKWSCSYNPLVITSVRGLLKISKSLATIHGLCVNAKSPRGEGCSSTQLASKYGFLKVLEWLIDSQGSELSPESHENSTIRLALRSGNEKVTMRVLQALLSKLSIKPPLESCLAGYDGYDDADSTSEISDDSDAPMASITWEGAALVDAVQCGSGQAVFDILLRISDPNVRDSRGRTPLIIAAMNGSVGIMEGLLKTKASVNAKDNNGRTAMHHACDLGHMSVVDVLIRHKNLDLKVQDKSLHTPMTAAIRADHQHIVMLLLSKLTNEAIKMEFANTAGNGQHHILEQILKYATDLDSKAHEEYVNARGWNSRTALHQAAFANYPRIVQFLLLRRAKLDLVDIGGMTPLADAAAGGYSSLQSLKLLLDAGASTEVMDRRRLLPLTRAIFEEKEAVVQLLLDKGAKPQLCCFWSHSDSLLDFTIMHSSLAVLQVLLEYFDKVIKSANDPLSKGIPTPTEALRSAIRCGNVRPLDALIGIWKDFDDTIYEGQDEVGTILHYAARYGSLASMKWVWARPNIATDVNQVVGYYGTPLQAALQGRHRR